MPPPYSNATRYSQALTEAETAPGFKWHRTVNSPRSSQMFPLATRLPVFGGRKSNGVVIQTLAQTGNRKTYDYTPEEAQACFGAIEEAARELYEALGLGGDTQASTPATEPQQPLSRLDPERRRVTIVRSKIDRAQRYLRDGNIEDAIKALNEAIQEAPADPV
jgi:tetratricopeptide (TPR) repeat protein